VASFLGCIAKVKAIFPETNPAVATFSSSRVTVYHSPNVFNPSDYLFKFEVNSASDYPFYDITSKTGGFLI